MYVCTPGLGLGYMKYSEYVLTINARSRQLLKIMYVYSKKGLLRSMYILRSTQYVLYTRTGSICHSHRRAHFDKTRFTKAPP
jgi:hypothetical protein